MNVLLLASHAIAEYDDVRMFTDMGVDVFAPGGYADPRNPGEGLRPAIPHAPDHPEFRALCDQQREKHAEDADWAIDWAKADVHPELLDWADAVIVHHFPERWIPRLLGKAKRVIWRTCGQSNPQLEVHMRSLRRHGLEVVRYSPAERRYFEPLGAWAGEDALIRFGKYPADYGPWTGEDAVVGNVTQHMAERGDATGYRFWLAATEGLPARPAGPGSEALPGGIGALGYDEMREYLRRCRAYLYTGTSPASYTLGLIEAMLTGVPVVSISARNWAGPDALFEGSELTYSHAESMARDGVPDSPETMRLILAGYLDHPNLTTSGLQRHRATELFGIDAVSAQWAAFLGVPVREAVAA